MKREISVFIASPNDLFNERKCFKKTLEQMNVGFGEGADVEFVPLGWEDTLAFVGRRNQDVINGYIDRCDVFILMLYRRWGQDAPDAKPYASYTEEEFYRALDRFNKEGKPEIFVFFKRVDAASEADPGAQLKKVIDFRKKLEDTTKIFYRYFDEETFENEIYKHLRAFAKGEMPCTNVKRDVVVLDKGALEEIAKEKESVNSQERETKDDSKEQALLKLEARELEIAEVAAALSLEGKVEFARQKFVNLIYESTNFQILSLAGEFFHRTGDLETASWVWEKCLNIVGTDGESAQHAIAYGNLGILYDTRGELEQAEEMFKKSLAIEEKLGHKEGMASDYGNLGIFYLTRGDLDRAEEMCLKSLVISEALGHKEGMANQYGNLGNLYQARGDFERAEEMYMKSLAIAEELGHKVGMACDYGNLGIIYQKRRDLERAEEMHKKSLAIEEALGHKEGMANQYGNLGILYKTRGELERAEEMHKKSLAIEEALGHKEGIASDYGNLGNIYQLRGELERAEEMYRKSLAIEDAIGHKEGMASDYGNLGNLYILRGELERAEEMHKKSLAIYESMGTKNGVAKRYANLSSLYEIRGELERAEEMRQKSLNILKDSD